MHAKRKLEYAIYESLVEMVVKGNAGGGGDVTNATPTRQIPTLPTNRYTPTSKTWTEFAQQCLLSWLCVTFRHSHRSATFASLVKTIIWIKSSCTPSANSYPPHI